MPPARTHSGSFSIAVDAAAAVRARWARPHPPAIADILTSDALADPDALAETLAADAEERRRRGIAVRLEDYLAANPSIADRPSACRALLMAEAVARSAEPEDAVRADLARRLPSLAGEIDAVMTLASIFREAAAETTPTRAPGATLGKYTLRHWLGEGTFGEVWQAWDSELQRYVALKILRGAHQSGVRGVQRFLAEIRAAAALDHESVVRIHAAGQFEETGEYFIDAQLVAEAAPTADDPRAVRPGRTLEQRLEGGPIPAREAAMLMAAAARGVAAAHARGITHRDIKPSNILVTASGRPLVADFGLSVSGFTARSSRDAEGTRTGESRRGGEPPAAGASAGGVAGRLAGTPAYMSPEQARGESVTPLSDVFALGATLRALLTGKPPYEPDPLRGESARDQVLTMARAGTMRPVREVRPELPRALCAICDRATAAAPASRYSTAEQLAADLEAFLAHRPVLADPPGAVRVAALCCRRHALTSIVAAVGAIIILGATTAFIVRVTGERDRAVAAEIEAARQRDAAVAARDVVETINTFLARTFNSTTSLEGTREILVVDAIELASERAGRSFADQPLIEAGVRHFLGHAALGAMAIGTAREQVDRALELRRKHLGDEHPDTLATRRLLAEVLADEKKTEEAETVFREILGPLRRVVGDDAPETLRTMVFLAKRTLGRGDVEGALEMLESAAAGYRRARYYGSADRQLALNALMLLYADHKKQYDKAEAVQREIIAMNEADLGREDISTLNATQALGWIHRTAGNYELAEAVYRDVLARYQAAVGPDHLGTLHVIIELASVVLRDRPEEGAALAREAVVRAESHGRGNATEFRALITLGKSLVGARCDDEAEEVFRRALETCIELRGLDHNFTREAARHLISVLERGGRKAEAAAVRARVPLDAKADR